MDRHYYFGTACRTPPFVHLTKKSEVDSLDGRQIKIGGHKLLLVRYQTKQNRHYIVRNTSVLPEENIAQGIWTAMEGRISLDGVFLGIYVVTFESPPSVNSNMYF